MVMDVFTQLAKIPIFSVKHVMTIVGNKKTAYSLIDRLMKKGSVQKIRNNMYSVVNPATGQLVANRYQIACGITDSSYISHHSAFDYYGLTNQVFHEVYVSSKTRFNHFEYDHITYKYVASRLDEGVEEAKNTSGVRITDLERTVIDSINDFNKIGGFEELLKCLDGVTFLDEVKLKHYLSLYNVQGLYQKVGYILSRYQQKMNLSDDFIVYCKKMIGKSKRYLVSEVKEGSSYNSEWELMVPDGLYETTDFDGDDFV